MIRTLRQLRRCAILLAAAGALASLSLVAPDVTPSVLAALARLREGAEEAERVEVQVGASRDLVFDAAVSAAVAADGELLAVAVSGARSVRLTGIAAGNTILIVTTEAGLKVYAVEVRPRPRPARPRSARRAGSRAAAAQGTYGLTLSRPTGGSELSVAHSLDFRQRLGPGRTLLASADLQNGGGEQRVVVSLETAGGSLDLLDSHVTAGQLGGGLSLRGARYKAAHGSSWDGLDLFAGSEVQTRGGTTFGAIAPVFRSSSIRLRAGALRLASPGDDNDAPRAFAELSYAPDDRTTLAAEFYGAAGRAAWGARLDLRRDSFDVAAEARQSWRSSAARTYAFSATLKPAHALRASARWHHAEATGGRGDSSAVAASLGYSFGGHSNLGLTLGRVRATASNFPVETAYAAATYHLNRSRWTNSLELRAGRTSPVAPTASPLGDKLFTNQLRREFGAWSLGGSYKYLSRDEEGGRRASAREAGASLRAAFARIRVEAGAYYRAVDRDGAGAGGVRAAGALSYRLDDATQLRFTLTQSLTPGPRAGSAGFSFSLTRRFGVGSGGALNPFRLFRRDAGARLAGVVFLDHNGNGARDEGEGGVANMVVSLDGGARTVKTDAGGGFRFDAGAGEHSVELLSERLGVSLLATGATSRRFSFGRGAAPALSFGVTDAAALSGRVYNDVGRGADDAPGVGGVRLRLAGGGHVAEAVTNNAGLFSFANIRPGAYTVELVPESLPADFRLPVQLTWPVMLEPIERESLRVGLVAERAIVGRVFEDRDGDGEYTPAVDTALEGAQVMYQGRAARSDHEGAYMLRGLRAGSSIISASRGGVIFFSRPLEFGAEPSTVTILIPAR